MNLWRSMMPKLRLLVTSSLGTRSCRSEICSKDFFWESLRFGLGPKFFKFIQSLPFQAFGVCVEDLCTFGCPLCQSLRRYRFCEADCRLQTPRNPIGSVAARKPGLAVGCRHPSTPRARFARAQLPQVAEKYQVTRSNNMLFLQSRCHP